jgi:hypothetical protein
MFNKSSLVAAAAFLSMTAIGGGAVHRLSDTAPRPVAHTSAAVSAAADSPAGSPLVSAPAITPSTPAITPSTTHVTTTVTGTMVASSAHRSAASPPASSLHSAAALGAPSTSAHPPIVAASGARVATNTPPIVRLPARPTAHRPLLGVYAGPDSKGVAGASAFGDAMGVQPQSVLDFGATDSWSNLTAPSWLISAHSGQPAQFELSLPMLPDGSEYTLAACASGEYDAQWRTTATNLIGHQLASTIVRPGWEFNGSWYRWSARSDVAGFIGCFRHIVDTMRSVPGQHFRFDWNPDVGPNSLPAEQAYPGDAYVDYIGVDVYDYSWSRYPAGSSGLSAAREAAWNDLLNGDHGLAFWSRFAAAHHKPMALPEWAAAVRSDGHGGGDNASFVNHVFDFIEDPANNVAYVHYFNTHSASNDHSLTAGNLPAAAAEYRQRALAIG